MKALAYTTAHKLDAFEMRIIDLPTPEVKDFDVLVKIKAIGFNPVDYKIRQNRSGTGDRPVILGWDASGVIEKIGDKVLNFKIGDEVYYAGDLTRNGTYAEYQAVDSRLISLKPKSLSFAEAAAIPLTAITAYEALILQNSTQYKENTHVLIIGGAGGVGSIGIQLLKQLTPVKVIATASRAETVQWCQSLGADYVIDHRKNLKEELQKREVPEVDFVFSTNKTDDYYPILADIIKPFGHFTLIDDPHTLDISPFKLKSIVVNYEFMFTRSMFKFEQEVQGKLLSHVASLLEQGKIKTTLNREFKGFSVKNVQEAHTILESGTSVGKMVMTF